MCVCLLISLIQFGFASTLQDSQPPIKKPVLIRADRTTDREGEVEVIHPDPVEANRNIRVGDFYFKRKNYKAARERYRDAVKYSPRRPNPYAKLIRVLERMEEFEEAVEVCRQFIETNPQASQVKDFESRIKKLETKVSEDPDP